MKGCLELRAELELLANPPGGAAAVRLDEQIPKIAALNERYPHGIAIYNKWDNDIGNINCFTYAFDLEDKIYLYIPDSSFVEYVLPKLVEINFCEAFNDDIAIYFDDYPRHAAKIKNGKFVSKWGGNATHIWEHGIFEVPLGYGNEVRYFRRLPLEESVRAYEEWWDL